MKTLVMVGMIAGSYAGAYVPLLWGAGVLSLSSIFFGAVGGFAGIWAGYQLARRLGLD